MTPYAQAAAALVLKSAPPEPLPVLPAQVLERTVVQSADEMLAWAATHWTICGQVP